MDYLIGICAMVIGVVLVKSFAHKIEKSMVFVPTVVPAYESYKLDTDKMYLENEIDKNVVLEETFIDKSISAIWFSNPKTKNVILYAHGNAGHIGQRLPFLRTFAPFSSVMMFDYSGYGKSRGAPTEQTMYDNILKVYNYLVDDKHIDPKNIIVYGESLGCVPTAWLGNHLKHTNKKPKALILQCGFSSLKNISQDLVGSFAFPLLSFNMDNIHNVRNIGDNIKIVVAHSRVDELIGFYHSELLAKANPYVTHFELSGSHCGPENFTENYLNMIKELFGD